MKKEKKYAHGFKVPPSYFEALEEKLISSINEDALPKQTGFSIPKEYFDSIEEKVTSIAFQKKETKVISIFKSRNIRHVSTLVAGFLLVLFFTLTKSKTTINSFDVAEIEAYIVNGNMDFETQDLSQLLNDDEIKELELTTLSLSDENLENYILENIDETTLLIE